MAKYIAINTNNIRLNLNKGNYDLPVFEVTDEDGNKELLNAKHIELIGNAKLKYNLIKEENPNDAQVWLEVDDIKVKKQCSKEKINGTCLHICNCKHGDKSHS
jgi:hypothetical protein